MKWEEIEPIEGWLSQDEAECLFNLAREINDLGLVAIEIGSWKGRSAVAMLQSGATVYCIDWFKGNPETEGSRTKEDFDRNTQKYKHNLITIPYKSGQARTYFKGHANFCGLLFIDGEHTKEAMLHDFFSYRDLLLSGSYVVFHDYKIEADYWPEVTEAVDLLVAQNYIEPVKQVNRCFVARIP